MSARTESNGLLNFKLARVMSCPYDEARSRFIAGQIALQQGQQVEAHQQFETAQGLFCQLGERRYAQQVSRPW